MNVVPGSGRSITTETEHLKNLNQSRYKTDFETPMVDIYRQTGKPVAFDIEAIYEKTNLSNRPDRFIAQYQKANGEWEKIEFENRAGG